MRSNKLSWACVKDAKDVVGRREEVMRKGRKIEFLIQLRAGMRNKKCKIEEEKTQRREPLNQFCRICMMVNADDETNQTKKSNKCVLPAGRLVVVANTSTIPHRHGTVP
jgi:hypothetical protein